MVQDQVRLSVLLSSVVSKGPTANTGLYDFLDRTNQVATHFMIGAHVSLL